MKKAVRKFWDKWFRGYPGPVGMAGERGAPGYLQLSGFPDGTRIVLYDDTYRPLWSGKLKKVNL